MEDFSTKKTDSENQNLKQVGAAQRIQRVQRSRLDEQTELETRTTVFLDQKGHPSKVINPVTDSTVLKNGQKVLSEAGGSANLQSWAFFNTDRECVVRVSIVQEEEKDPQKRIASYQTEIRIHKQLLDGNPVFLPISGRLFKKTEQKFGRYTNIQE